MKIDLDRFLALTTMLAAPLVTAGCILNTGSDDDEDSGASATEGGSADDAGTSATDASGGSTSLDDGGTTDGGTTEGGTTDGGTSGTSGTDDAADTTGGGNPLGNCCEAQEGTGCEVAEVEECVCLEDPYCCEMQWDATCAQSVNTLGCGECVFPPSPWDCSCITDCDGTPVDTTWQVCGGDELEAAAAGLAACETELDEACDVFVCDECSCFTAEVPEIEC